MPKFGTMPPKSKWLRENQITTGKKQRLDLVLLMSVRHRLIWIQQYRRWTRDDWKQVIGSDKLRFKVCVQMEGFVNGTNL
ncbi:hypothetical protein AVEN_243645-1 [Araneus ventricosus]|uniref:Uncharacterized protein n=1 Tax=Araneus ventricosus TaxID=182803 RepID=A0A4Y2A5T4_ARAVE|nr:hypothetical protein AVEN_243645-1 [Araneus ventricosus]